ncbi:MAG: MoaD/ThiS family protein [bacterium]
MAELSPGPVVTVRYFAGARAAAGVVSEDVAARTVAELHSRITAGRDARFAQIVGASTLMFDGRPLTDDRTILPAGATVEVLPPFAGG